MDVTEAELPVLEDECIESDDDWVDEDENISMTSSACLFCDTEFKSAEDTLRHCQKKHGFDIIQLRKTLSLNCFTYIKMINYIRLKSTLPAEINAWCVGQLPYKDDSYMKPTMADDGLLQFDIDNADNCPELRGDSMSDHSDNGAVRGDTCSPQGNTHINHSYSAPTEKDGFVTIPVAQHNELLGRMQMGEARAVAAEEGLRRAMADLNILRQTTQNLVMSQPVDIPSSDQAIQEMHVVDDSDYIDCYNHFGIHQEMLQDKVRTESYRDSMYENRHLFQDKVVMDVGCGTGILSLFAARAGAKKVIAIDMAETIYQAMDIVRENKMEDKITLLKGRLEDIDLMEEKVDIIISEWMGYFLLFESMLDTVVYARDHHLAQDGIVLPDHCRLCLTGAEDKELHHKLFGFWDDVYGFRMSCMKTMVEREGVVLQANKETISTDHCVLKELDVCTCTTKDVEFSSDFSLIAQRDTDLTMLVGYFDIAFTKGKNEVQFSTGPMSPVTHWKQTLLLLREPIALVKGESISGRVVVKKNKKDPRSLDITVTMRGHTNTYFLD